MRARKAVLGKQVVRKSDYLCFRKGENSDYMVINLRTGEKRYLGKSGKIRSRLKAARAVLGMWADKDTSFFDR